MNVAFCRYVKAENLDRVVSAQICEGVRFVRDASDRRSVSFHLFAGKCDIGLESHADEREKEHRAQNRYQTLFQPLIHLLVYSCASISVANSSKYGLASCGPGAASG